MGLLYTIIIIRSPQNSSGNYLGLLIRFGVLGLGFMKLRVGLPT